MVWLMFFYNAKTNGITYHSMIFPCKNLSIDELNSSLSNTITDVGLGDKNYEEVQNSISDNWGHIIKFYSHSDKDGGDPTIGLKISSKSLEANENKMQNLMIKRKDANFKDKNRIEDLVNFIPLPMKGL